MMPKVFISKSFLLWLSQFRNILPKKLNVQERKWQHFLENLVYSESLIYLDANEDTIMRYIKIAHKVEEAINKDEELIANEILELSHNNKIRCCKEELEIFKGKKYSSYDRLIHKPNFIFLSTMVTNEFCKEISNEFGTICLNNQLDFSYEISDVQREEIPANHSFTLSEKFPFLPPTNAAIILDQYLLNNDRDGSFIEELVRNLRPENLKVTFHLTILSSHTNNREEIINRLRNRISNINVIWQELGRFDDKHDRHIFTNNFHITSGWGFQKLNPIGSTTVTYFPNVGKHYQKNLETLKLKTQRLNLDNRLCK